MGKSKKESYIPTCDEFYKGCEEFKKREPRDAMYKVAIFLVTKYWKEKKVDKVTDGLGVLLLTWNQAFYRYGSFDFEALENCISKNFKTINDFRKRNIHRLEKINKSDIMALFSEFLKALQIDTMRFSDENKNRYTKESLKEVLQKLNINYEDSDNLEKLYNSIKYTSQNKEAFEFVDKEQASSKKNYIEVKISKLRDREKKCLESLNIIARSPVSVSKALHLLAPIFFPLWDNKIANGYQCCYKNNPADQYFLFCKKIQEVANEVKNCNCVMKAQEEKSGKTIIKLIDEYNYAKYTKGWV